MSRRGCDHIGIVPWSIRETVFDVDAGSPDGLPEPRVSLPTRRGWHNYYDDCRGRRNRNGVSLPAGVKGDVRSANGQCRLHGIGVVLLSEAMARTGVWPWQPDLFESCGEPAARGPATERLPATRVTEAVEPSRRRREACPRVPLEKIPIGFRNAALFEHVRHWAYGTRRARLDWIEPEWTDCVLQRALGENARFPVPLPVPEVRDVAASISSWIYDGGLAGWTPRTWTPEEREARRRKGGMVRNRNIRAANLARNRAIAQAAKTATNRDVARRFGVSPSTVSRITAGELLADGSRFPILAVSEVEARFSSANCA